MGYHLFVAERLLATLIGVKILLENKPLDFDDTNFSLAFSIFKAIVKTIMKDINLI